MAVSLLHAFTSPQADGADATQVRPSNWNAQHVLTSGANTILGNNTGSTGNVVDLSVAQVNALLSNGGMKVDGGSGISGVSAVNIPLPSTYQRYTLRLEGVYPSTTSAGVFTRFSTNGGSSYFSNSGAYAWSGHYATNNTTAGNYDSSSGGSTAMAMFAGNQNTSNLSIVMLDIFVGDSVQQPSYLVHSGYMNSSGTITNWIAYAYLGATGPATHIQLVPSSGTMSVAKWTLYGYPA